MVLVVDSKSPLQETLGQRFCSFWTTVLFFSYCSFFSTNTSGVRGRCLLIRRCVAYLF